MFLNEALGFFGILVLFQVNGRDVRAFFGKSDCHCATDPAVPAGNQRDFVLQFTAAAMFCVLSFRTRLHFVLATRLLFLMLRRQNFLFLGHKRISPVIRYSDALQDQRARRRTLETQRCKSSSGMKLTMRSAGILARNAAARPNSINSNCHG